MRVIALTAIRMRAISNFQAICMMAVAVQGFSVAPSLLTSSRPVACMCGTGYIAARMSARVRLDKMHP